MEEIDQFYQLIRELNIHRDNELRSQFNRSLPFQDALFDRWERARRLGFGDGSSIYNSAVVFDDVFVDAETWVGPNVMLDGSGGGIRIGKTCSISTGVHIYTHDTIGWTLSGGKVRPRQGRVLVGDRTYIGSQSIVAAGVAIGNQCVIAANSFVNRNVDDRTIVGGTPAKRLGVVEFADEEPYLKFDNGVTTALTSSKR